MIEFIQSLNEKELRYIAASDYGDREDEYFKELKQIIIHQSCIIYPQQQYMPGEVITLCSNTMEAKHGKEFVACNLLLMTNRGAFDNLDLAAKFKGQEYDYKRLSEPYSNLIYLAYKWAGF